MVKVVVEVLHLLLKHKVSLEEIVIGEVVLVVFILKMELMVIMEEVALVVM